MASDLVRPFLTMHVFGSKGCGKTTFKTQWFDSSQSRALSEIADVHVRIQKEASYGVMDSIRTAAGLDGGKHLAFVIIYRPDDQASIQYGEAVLDKIYTTFDYTSQVNITFLENHFEKEFRPHTEEPTEFPLSSCQRDVLASRNPPQLWRVVLTDSVQISAPLDKVITQPLLAVLDESSADKLIKQACVEGKVQVLKLLAGVVTEINSMLLISHTMSSLEQRLQPDSAQTMPTEPLLEVASYLYHLDPTLVMSVIARATQDHPRASLKLLKNFCRQSSQEEHFVMTGVALVCIPAQWVANLALTHVKLSNNLLQAVPEELLQLATLQSLNLSHNQLESLPSVLKWNCPKLKELDVSHNRLLSRPYCILEGRKNKEPKVDLNPPSIGRQRDVLHAVQWLLSLTGYNLYPCVCALTRVSIGHNPALTQVPEWVCVLPSLTLLEMKGLPRLTKLTPHLAHCRSLLLIQLDTEHLISPPPDQAQKGTRNILTYLRCQLRGSTPYRHIKLVIVGEKGAGKSTLFRQFVKGSGRAESHMDVATFEYPSRIRVRKDKPRITFHVIDFAGDEIYRCTHNCFLTYRSLYLCLWNTTGGKASLQRLCPWLHSIQACVPGSPVLLVATHANKRPGLSAGTILQWEDEVLGKAVQLRNKTTARRLGFPPIMQSVVMDCLNREDVDLLLSDIYDYALQMRHPKTNVPFMSDLLPRSYQELQTLVEVKVRNLCLERRVAPVLRHEELVDYVRSLTISNPHGLEQDEEEFSLACHFLHEAGAIVHYKSQVAGVSDLYFLDPQWLFNALATVIEACCQGDAGKAVIGSGEWPHFFQQAGIPASMYGSFLAMMETFNIIVSLDFEKKSFLLPSLLPDTPPPQYPTYDLCSDLCNICVQYMELEYLPPSLFPQLIARVILHIKQLSGQLLSISASPDGPSATPTLERKSAGGRPVSSQSSLSRRSQAFHVDSQGYLSQDDLTLAGQDDGERLRKIWGLSMTSCGQHSSTLPRYKHLMQKLAAISQPILRQSSQPSGDDPSLLSKENSSSHTDQFASYSFWKKGLFCEFGCGTRLWLEACENAIALVVSGELVPRVRVLSFLASSIDALLEECFLGLKMVSYSPCPTCLQRFWAGGGGNGGEDMPTNRNLALSSLEQSCEVQMNEFSECILYLKKREGDTSSQSQRFSGSKFTLSTSPPPETGREEREEGEGEDYGGKFDDLPKVATLDSSLTLFPLSTTVQQSVMSSSILCPTCKVRVPLETISPHVLLADFKDHLLLKAKHLQFQEDQGSTLGRGGFGKVFKGTYKEEPVAIKVFRKGYLEDVLLRRYKDLREELSIMSQLQHPRVVALVGVCLKPLAMVLKLAPLGSLKMHIELCPHGMESQVAHQVLYQIADGIQYLHSLYIVHRDIKPSNVLVWALHPSQGVDVKLADYGVSQFSSPSGLYRHKGTEEYMAPELFHDKRKLAYDEKVDVFSFGLVLHVVVTGRRLFAGIMNKREQLRFLYDSDFPQLSSALAEALAENKPPPSLPPDLALSLRGQEGEEGEGLTHPAARRDVISACHSSCMQPLLEGCLASNPQARPSAQGLCSRLLVCPGTTSQVDYYISAPVSVATSSPSQKLVVGIQRDRPDHISLFPVDSWRIRRCPAPYSGQDFSCLEVVGDEVFLTARDSLLVYSLQLPGLQSGHISSSPLPAQACSLFSCLGPRGHKVVVGMDGARIAVFSVPEAGGHLLESQPLITQVVQRPDAQDKAIGCGLFFSRTLWCGCGTYLVGLDPGDLLMKHYKPLLTEEGTEISMMAASHKHLWVGFSGRSYLAVCNSKRPGDMEMMDCHSILGKTNVSLVNAAVTGMASGCSAVWVVTGGGHMLAFDPVTADVLLVHHRSCSFSSVVCLSDKKVVTFGEGLVGGAEGAVLGEGQETTGMFTVWEEYIQ